MKTDSKWAILILVVLVMLAWSTLFYDTYALPFVWDDLHVIRSYSLAELTSVFHGTWDPDGVETKALRPIGTLLYHFQGATFGENMVLQRVFMAVLMAGLLFAVGLLLREVGLSLHHIVVVFSLFASSRVFTSVVLWITIGNLLLSYIFVVLTALFYLRWLKRDSNHLLALTFGFAILATFSREEAYTLPVILPLLWWISSRHRENYQRAFVVALGVALIAVLHYVLRSTFVPDAPQPHLAPGGLLASINSAWMPGGYMVVGRVDRLINLLWIGFVGILTAVFIRISSDQRLEQCFGSCFLAIILSTPALAVPRSFGIALPSLAFFTAISIAIVEVHRRAASGPYLGRFWRPAIVSALLGVLALGVAAGVKRSKHVAEALSEDSAEMVVRDGQHMFDMFGKPETIPETRREGKLARLNALGVRSPEDVRQLWTRTGLFTTLEAPLFAAKYPYLSF